MATRSRVRRRARFRKATGVRRLVWTLLALALLLGAVPGVYAALAHGREAGRPHLEVVVAPGDTLWTIAERHGPRTMDTRYVVFLIRKANGLPSADIRPGQVIKVPLPGPD